MPRLRAAWCNGERPASRWPISLANASSGALSRRVPGHADPAPGYGDSRGSRAGGPSRPLPGTDTVLDLGTGTGCLLLATLSEFAGAFGVGVDLAPAALALASRNAQTLGLADRAAFLCADWAAPLAGPFDLILSNPPYVATSAIEGLAPEVASFEPRRALDGGADGLDAYRRIIPILPRMLGPRGVAVLELGIGQAEQVSDLARRTGLATSVRPDLAGIPRALVVLERLP